MEEQPWDFQPAQMRSSVARLWVYVGLFADHLVGRLRDLAAESNVDRLGVQTS